MARPNEGPRLGIAQRDDGMIFGGVTLVAALCLSVEGLSAIIQRRVTSPGLARPTTGPSRLVQPGAATSAR